MSWSKRICIDSALIALVLFAPWYIPAICGLIYYWKYEHIEVVGVAGLMDIAYASYTADPLWIFPMLTCTYITVLLIIVLDLLKQKIRFYA